MAQIKHWDLTKEEIKKLTSLQARRMAVKGLLNMLTEQMTNDAKNDARWWSDVLLKHSINGSEAKSGKLVADVKLGKIWVKDEVPEFDKLASYAP